MKFEQKFRSQMAEEGVQEDAGRRKTQYSNNQFMSSLGLNAGISALAGDFRFPDIDSVASPKEGRGGANLPPLPSSEPQNTTQQMS